ncbi:MAG: DNA mismatch repair protein MutS [Flavobacteriaceae bacterium]|nr:DNA mismatch repair protein MutS [Flavobacteriaceae bacterium]
MAISLKTLQDLEFPLVLNKVATYCVTQLGKELATKIVPFTKKAPLVETLKQTHEYLASFESDNRLPSHYFDNISKEIHLLNIEDSYLDVASFLKIVKLVDTTNEHLKFLKKYKAYYPTLYLFSSHLIYDKTISKTVLEKISDYGEVLDKASVLLKAIRREIREIKGLISGSFNTAMSKANSSGYLDEIKESLVDNQRVLAVTAMYRKKVKGVILGTSKSGSIAFIAPEATQTHTRRLQNLEFEEKEEIIAILKALTNTLRPFVTDLEAYQNYLTHIDCVAAKAGYASKIKAILPTISDEKACYYKEAYHPLLFEQNNALGLKTIPQSLKLDQQQHIIVISGPNAGGKSITLKTIGLLQIMFQSGLLVPVHRKSSFHLFDTVLTDIGDNQSIENQLSTYSYRLKNMRQFLRKSNNNTLLLIDEFGTGSDPELGGALAEVFLEEFHAKNAFGVITTHYANLKVLADELPFATNANMQFDERSLEPLFKLFVGQAGSSFTFEVASKNGIPYSLINRAKKKVSGEKVRLDRSISKLQKERNRLQRNSENLEKEHLKVKEKGDLLANDQEKIHQKLTDFNVLYEENQKMLTYGRKVNELLNRFFQTKNKKKLLADFFNWTAAEQTKHIKKTTPVKLKTTKTNKPIAVKPEKVTKEKLKNTEKQVLKEVTVIRKVASVKAKIRAQQKANYIFKPNDRVRLEDGTAVGTISKIEKNKVFINYGFFTTTAKLNQIELVEKG